MASVGHVAVGMAAARIHNNGLAARWRSVAMWSALSMLPDADVIGFAIGIPYGDPWGHRGATHSFAFSIVVGTAIGLIAPRFRLPALRTGILATLVLTSHAVLDTLTDGGLGCALFWPFDTTRYLAPWRPITAAPIGLGFISIDGLMVSLLELVVFAPVFLFALRPALRGLRRRITAALFVVWLVAGWFITSTDPVRERVVGLVLGDDTEFAAGFSEATFRTVQRGQAESEIRSALGPPLREFWFYGAGDRPAFETSAEELNPGCLSIGFDNDAVNWSHFPELCSELGITAGTRMADVVKLLGVPSDACLQYGRSRSGGYFRLRDVCLFKGRVTMVLRRWSRAQD